MILRFKKPKDFKVIRQYRRVAWTTHDCWRCDHPIEPGDEYIGEIMVGESGLSVWKQHVHCPGKRHDEEDEPSFDEDKSETLEELAA